MKNRSPKEYIRCDRDIRASTVRVISPTGENLGVMTIEQARARAESYGLNLIEISAGAKPPVCKIMEYGKYKYDISRKKREGGGSKTVDNKEIRLKLATEEHDLNIKIAKARSFLIDGDRVTITLRLYGREIERVDTANEVLHKIQANLADCSRPFKPVFQMGKRFHLVLEPLPKNKSVKFDGGKKCRS